MQKALGMVETIGVVPLIEAVDAMVKAADVSLEHWEAAGSGRVSAFVLGDVAAVKAAVDAGAEAASRLGKVMAAQVIANPHEDLSVFYDAKSANKRSKE